MKTFRAFEVSLWVVLAHWYALILVIVFECTHSGTGWIAEVPWDFWLADVVDGLVGGKVQAGALLVFCLYALITVSALVLAYIFAKISANAIGTLKRKRKADLKITAAGSATPSAVAAADDSDIGTLLVTRPDLQAHIENFRNQMRKVSGNPG